jgi:hypothetical protein
MRHGCGRRKSAYHEYGAYARQTGESPLEAQIPPLSFMVPSWTSDEDMGLRSMSVGDWALSSLHAGLGILLA